MTSEKTTIIWGMSPGGKYAHAFLGEKAVAAGVPICGISCRPRHVLAQFDPDDGILRDVTCPKCRARLHMMHLAPTLELRRVGE